jgi:hypothetical protein
MSQYIMTLLTTAKRDKTILDESFVLNAWNKKMKEAKITTEQKETLVLEIMKTIDAVCKILFYYYYYYYYIIIFYY